MGRGRSVRLVVADPAGSALGAIGPLAVEQPWWQEVGPVHDAIAGDDRIRLDAVLRLLAAEPDDDGPMGGRVTYAVVGEVRAGARLDPVTDDELALLAPHPRRLPWAEPAGPGHDRAWVESVVEVTGPARQHRSWNLSAVWSFPTPDGPVWLKTVPPFLAHEGAVLRTLSAATAGVRAGPITPTVLATDRHRQLLADLPGRDGHGAGEAEQIPMIETLVDVQAATVDRLESLLAAGVPDLRAEALAAELRALVERRESGASRGGRRGGGERLAVRALVDDLDERLARAADASPPDSLVHGDPHPGNARAGVDPPIWFDWGDAFVGNPLLDLAATHRLGPSAVEAWLSALIGRWPGCDPAGVAELLAPVAQLRQAWVYQRFLDGIEPTEHVYHRDDVDDALDATEALLA